MPTSQAARPGQFYTLSWNGGGNGATDCLFPLPCLAQGILFWEIREAGADTRIDSNAKLKLSEANSAPSVKAPD